MTATTFPTGSLAQTVTPAHAQRLRQLAGEIEAQAISAFFQPVFASLPTGGPFGGGTGEAQWRPMMVDAIARDLARSDGLGIGEAIYRELLRIQEGAAQPQVRQQA